MKMQTAGSSPLRSKGRDDGFTVAEFVAAAAILLIVLAGVLGAVQYAGASTRMASTRQAAIDVATHQIELARNLPWSSVGLKYSDGTVGNPAGSVPANQVITTAQGTFNVTSQVTWVLDKVNMRSSYKKMTVTVAWSDPSPGGAVSVETNIFGVGGLANTGDVLFTCRDDDDPAKLIQGIGLTLNGQFVSTGIDGSAFFGQVAIGTATFSASSPSYLVDTSGLTLPIIVAAGYQNLGFIDCQVPSTAVIKVVGNSGQVLQGVTLTLTDTDTKHPRTVSGTTGADGSFTFSNLWKTSSSSQPYSVSASYNGRSSSGTFLVTTGGQTISQTLTIAEPSVIAVFVKDGTTGNLITGQNMTIAVTDQSTGAQLAGSPSTVTSGTAVFAITKSGNYNVSVKSVAGYSDSPTNVISATFGTGANNVTVSLQPLTQLNVTVRTTNGPTGLANIPVTVLNPSGTAVGANGGATVTNNSGVISYTIMVAGNHTVSASVNGKTYYTSPSPVNLLAGQSADYNYYIDIAPGTLNVVVTGPYSGSKTRLLVVTDSTGQSFFSAQVQATTTTIPLLMPGAYTVSAYSKDGKTKNDYPATVVSNTTVTLNNVQSPN